MRRRTRGEKKKNEGGSFSNTSSSIASSASLSSGTPNSTQVKMRSLNDIY